MLADIEDAEDAARGIDSLAWHDPHHDAGHLRRAKHHSAPAEIPQARIRCLRVELSVVDERQDLVAEGTDVAIRLGPLDNSGFGARSLRPCRASLVASPSYLAERGTPKTPADLASHDCIFGPGLSGRTSWSFTPNGTETSVDVRGRITTNSGPGVFASVLAGLGIAITSPMMAGPEIDAGTLVPLLKSYKLSPVDVYAVFPAGPPPLDQGARSGRTISRPT